MYVVIVGVAFMNLSNGKNGTASILHPMNNYLDHHVVMEHMSKLFDAVVVMNGLQLKTTSKQMMERDIAKTVFNI